MNLDFYLQLAKSAAQEAGASILKYYQKEYELSHKDDKKENPLTSADLEANHILEKQLRNQTPDFGWLSEETTDDLKRLEREWVWIVDPLDGTKEFTQQIPEFGVSIGLVYQGIPQLGVFYNPVKKLLYWGKKGSGLFINEKPAPKNQPTSLSNALILVSRSEFQKGKFQAFTSDDFQLQPMGSIANKLAQVAAGNAQITLTLSPRSEWDICAGAFFILETGGKVSDLQQNPILFNQEKPLVSGIIACPPTLYPALLQCLHHKKALPR